MLSHYRVTAALGAGGMGEVYRATDTNLHRDVAIKVLPPEVAQDPRRLERFRREAHLLAALNHPNIAAIYGLEEADGKPFLALELVEGEDLKERLSRGAVPVDEALEIAKQIADALEEAHNKGIVHRDLKPANVKLTPAGKVKVLDFGLAKAWAGDAAGVNSAQAALSQSPTLAYTGTMAGVILGTAAYMSPEQARGKPVDKRADVWSFGVLLWEMLTGRPLFTGETVTDVIAAVMSHEPDLRALPASTPAAVRRLIARCLRRDPRQRLPDIGTARLDLQEALAGGASGAEERLAAAPGTERWRRWERAAWALVAIAATSFAVATAFSREGKSKPAANAVHFVVDPPKGWSFGPTWPVPSPDGRQVAFLAFPSDDKTGRAPMAFVRSLHSPGARPLAGTEGPAEGAPFWSPDGRHLAFFTGRQLRRLALADGTVQRICAQPTSGFFSGDWGESGTILLAGLDAGAGIYAVAATGGEPRPLTKVDDARGEGSHVAPQFLPGEGRFLFAVGNGGQNEGAGIYLSSLDAPHERHLVEPVWGRRVLAGGHLLFAREGTLYARPFGEGRAGGGAPAAIASGVAMWRDSPEVGWFGSAPGTLAYLSAPDTPNLSQLAWLGRNGHRLGDVGTRAEYGQISLSPDATKAAAEIRDSDQSDLWVMDLERGMATRVTRTPDNELDPIWSPDGKALAYCVRQAGTRERGELRRKGLRVGDPEAVLAAAAESVCPESWARDGTLVGTAWRSDNAQVAWARAPDGNGRVGPLPPGNLDELQISPDGRWLAYVSAESGRHEVYVEPFRRDGERLRVSLAGGGQPKWRADGGELFFTAPGGQLLAATVRAEGDGLRIGAPTLLFEIGGLFPIPYFDDYAPGLDGQRFLVKIPVEQSRALQLHVVTGWKSLLER